MINTTDLFATIADLAGTGVTRSGDSISFKHLLVDESGPQRSFLYAEFHDPRRKWSGVWAIRDSRYKLIQFEGIRPKLYDLIEDPFEKQNLLEPDPTADDRAIADSLAHAAAEIRQDQ